MKTLLRTVLTLLLFAPLAVLAQNTVSFALDTTISTDRETLTPKLTWSTTPAATSCTASGDAAWTGTKAVSGTQTLTAFPATESRSYVLVCNWPGDTQAALTWIPPTTFTDGSPLPKCAAATDTGQCITGYMIEFGTSATSLTQSRFHMFPQASTATVTGLTSGTTYFFALRTLTGQGAQSIRSNTSSKVLAATVQVSQQAGIKLPNAPTLN